VALRRVMDKTKNYCNWERTESPYEVRVGCKPGILLAGWDMLITKKYCPYCDRKIKTKKFIRRENVCK
jgi:hypothetical protein